MTRPPERWEAPLALLSRSVRGVLGPWLPRLAARLGPLAARPRRAPRGAPEGLSGLTRRGSWERLLHTGWALAESHPDEFLRRATAAENLFLHMAHELPVAAPRVVTWFDAGPDQLGAPRAVQLALWLVLAQRVADGSGVFRFGVLQDPSAGWCEDTGRPGGERLLAGRSLSHPTPLHAESWQPQIEGTPDERWVVGGRRCVNLAARLGARLIRIEEGIGDAPLSVTVDGGSPVYLDLPSRAQLGGLLHDPWVKRAPKRAPPPRALQVVPDSTATRPLTMRDGVLTRWSVPYGRGWKRPRVHSRSVLSEEYRQWMAVGRCRRRMVVLCSEGDTLRTLPFTSIPGQHPLVIDRPSSFSVDSTGAPGFLHVLPRPTGYRDPHDTLLVTDAAGVLWLLDSRGLLAQPLGELAGRPWRSDHDIIAHFSDQPTPTWLERRCGPSWRGRADAIHVVGEYWQRPVDMPRDLPPPTDVVPAFPSALAAVCGEQVLCLQPGEQPVALPRPAELHVVGALLDEGAWSLVGLARDRRTICIRGAHQADLQPAFASILGAWISPSDPVLYWSDAAGYVGCVELPSGSVQLRWRLEDAP